MPPTSVEAERIFSICGQFYTSISENKHINGFSKKAASIDMFVFTKYFLLRNKDNKFLDIYSMFLHEIINCTLFILLICSMNTFV